PAGAADGLRHSVLPRVPRPASAGYAVGADHHLFDVQSVAGDLADAAVLRNVAARAGGSGLDRWCGVLADPAACGAADRRTRAGCDRDPVFRIFLERLLFRADP